MPRGSPPVSSSKTRRLSEVLRKDRGTWYLYAKISRLKHWLRCIAHASHTRSMPIETDGWSETRTLLLDYFWSMNLTFTSVQHEQRKFLLLQENIWNDWLEWSLTMFEKVFLEQLARTTSNDQYSVHWPKLHLSPLHWGSARPGHHQLVNQMWSENLWSSTTTKIMTNMYPMTWCLYKMRS